MNENRINALCAEVPSELLLALNLYAANETNPEVRAGRLDMLAYIQRRAGMYRTKTKGAAAPAVDPDTEES